jgi:DNA repair protein RadC
VPGDERGPHLWRFARERGAAWERERLFIVALDGAYKIMAVGETTRQHLSTTRLRKLLEDVPLAQVAMLVCVHHQARVNPESSKEDEAIAQRLRRAADRLGIRLLDHVIFCRGRYRSLGDRLAVGAAPRRGKKGRDGRRL